MRGQLETNSGRGTAVVEAFDSSGQSLVRPCQMRIETNPRVGRKTKKPLMRIDLNLKIVRLSNEAVQF